MQTLTDTEEPQHSHRPPRNLARHIRRGDDGRPVDGDTLALRDHGCGTGGEDFARPVGRAPYGSAISRPVGVSIVSTGVS